MNRRYFLTGTACLGLGVMTGLAGCGFKLRGNQSFAFESIAVNPSTGGLVAAELRNSLGTQVRLVDGNAAAAQGAGAPQVTLDILSEQREKTVAGVNAAGQVREFQLRIRVKFRLRTAQGKDLILETEVLHQRDISFNESAVLAKETEEALLYRDMQTDIVQQLLRRLAAVRAL